MYQEAKLTSEQKQAMDVARIGFMNVAPFFCYYYYAEMKEFPTLDISTAATDGRRLFYNPQYLTSLQPAERMFVLAHEVYHAVSRHPARIKHYHMEDNLRGHPWSQELFNMVADYIINADLIKNNIGQCNPSWLYDPNIKPEELVEDVYERLIRKSPTKSGNAGGHGNPTYSQSNKSGSKGKGDRVAEGNGGAFDEVLPPQVDPVTGKEDLPSDSEFREAVARAAAAAKATGNMPASFQRLVDEILEPQVNWREHIRMLVTGRIGSRSETWEKPNRRRLVFSPMMVNGKVINQPVVMPGRHGFGARDVAVAIDTSGSIGDRELAAFRAEVGGILLDVRPKRIYVIWCDARVGGVDAVTSLDEARAMQAKGGGGTDFRPPFQWLADNDVHPEAMIYLTDLMGPFPNEAPAYPVIWCATTDEDAPWGEVVRIKV